MLWFELLRLGNITCCPRNSSFIPITRLSSILRVRLGLRGDMHHIFVVYFNPPALPLHSIPHERSDHHRVRSSSSTIFPSQERSDRQLVNPPSLSDTKLTTESCIKRPLRTSVIRVVHIVLTVLLGFIFRNCFLTCTQQHVSQSCSTFITEQ